MDDRSNTKVLLAIESAISGGSISLWSNSEEIDRWIGEGGVSRAEDLLPNIAEMLKRNSISRAVIGSIAVSIGPGSFTGIRIGIATALGLRVSLGIPLVGISILEAIVLEQNAGRILAAVPMGRDAICYQMFDLTDRAAPVTIFGPLASRSVPEGVVELNCQRALMHESILQFARREMPAMAVESAGFNMAGHVARAAMVPEMRGGLEPLFLGLTAR